MLHRSLQAPGDDSSQRAGATYHSDNFAVVDKRGMVHPNARPLQVKGKRLPFSDPTSARLVTVVTFVIQRAISFSPPWASVSKSDPLADNSKQTPNEVTVAALPWSGFDNPLVTLLSVKDGMSPNNLLVHWLNGRPHYFV